MDRKKYLVCILFPMCVMLNISKGAWLKPNTKMHKSMMNSPLCLFSTNSVQSLLFNYKTRNNRKCNIIFIFVLPV